MRRFGIQFRDLGAEGEPVVHRSPRGLLSSDRFFHARRAFGVAKRVRSLVELTLVCVVLAVPSMAQSTPIDAPPAGVIESGVPSFVVIGPEVLGLAAAPVDLQQLPDGRLLAVGRGELALGDGERWEVFRQAKNDELLASQSVAIDKAGQIYAGVSGGFAQVVFQPDGRWRFRRVGDLPPDTGIDTGTPVQVNVINGEWLWWWGSGPIISWRPGTTSRILGHANAAERAFILDGTIHLSDFSTGVLARLEEGEFRPVPLPKTEFVEQLITCTVPLGDGRVLAGTNQRGLMMYEGNKAQPFVSEGLLGGEHRINDLCVMGDGLFAAAIDNVGVVFFDRSGAVVQVLDRTVDHRLSRPKRLLRTSGGVLWALLNEGIARVGFPSRVSNFEPLVPTGLDFAQPYRYRGRLWLMSDGRAQRGIYDSDKRLTGFAIDSPESYMSSLVELDGEWLATARGGIYQREREAWVLVADGPDSAQIRPEPVLPGMWLYVATNEVGWIRRVGGRFTIERFPSPNLGHPFGTVADGRGVFWAELGAAKVARIEPTLPQPTVHLYGQESGIPNGWAQVFLLGGEARLNIPPAILRFDSATDRFVTDASLLQHLPSLQGALGRPTLDTRGFLWATHEGHVHVSAATGPSPPGVSVETIPEGLVPLHITPQSDGVVWLHQRGRLARFDPGMPEVPEPLLRALITRVQLPASNREISSVGGDLQPLAATDNSLVVHYLAPNNPVGQSVTFEVMMEGASGGWISTGTSGSSAFNRLASGRYVLHVRPRLGARVGEEARLAIVVLAPWYLTPVAYSAYVLGIIGVFALVGWFSTYFERREKARLERVVTARTQELQRSNEKLEVQIQLSRDRAEALRTSEDRYRRLSENAPDIIFRVRLGPPIAYDYISPAVQRITGYAPAEFYSRVALVPDIVQPGSAEELRLRTESGIQRAATRELRVKARDGSLVILEVRLVQVCDSDGELTAIEGIARDVTARRLAEEEIRRLSQAVEQSPVAVYITDVQGGIVFANPRMCELTGRSNAELLKQNLRDLGSEFARAELFDEVLPKISSGESWSGQVAIQSKDGRVLQVRTVIAPLRGPDGAIANYLVLKEDITQSVEDQAQQRRLEAQLFQAQKLESIGTLAGGIAHDFNNILTGIMGYCELATLAAPEDPELRADLDEIRIAGLRAKELVAQILTFSRRGGAKLEAMDLAAVVAEALKLVRASAPAMIEIVRELESGMVKADATQIHQIVLNLCTNSLHAMRERAGRLTVRVQCVTVDAALAADFRDLKPGDWMRLEVQDTGSGMDEQTLARIFDPFFTTKQQGEGTGLGLAMVQGIVANHHGALRVRSTSGVGTTFEIFLPVTSEAALARQSAGVVPRGGQREVLVVDDELSVAKFVALRLEQFDYRTSVFCDPIEALAAFRREPERYHVVVTDLTMPHFTGVELIRQIRADGQLVPAVITSGFSKLLAHITPETVPSALVLSKPFSGEELVRVVGRVLGLS